jgi:hypothetical protein
MPRLTLHIGQPKSATTTVQTFLAANAALLARQGWLYPQAGRQGVGHHAFAGFFRDTPLDWVEPADPMTVRDALWREVRRSGCTDVILSSEALFYARTDPGRVRAYFEGFDIRIAVSLRRQDEWLESALRDNLKTGHYPGGSHADYAIGLTAAIDYALALDRWAAVFGDAAVIVMPFEPTGTADAVAAAFLAALGAPMPPGAVPVPPQNDRLSQEALAFLGLAGPERRILPRHSRWFAILAEWSRMHPDEPEHRYILAPDLRATIMARMGPGNAAVARRFLGRADGSLFSPPAPDPAPWAPHPGLTPARAAEIGRFLAERLTDALETAEAAVPPPRRYPAFFGR